MDGCRVWTLQAACPCRGVHVQVIDLLVLFLGESHKVSRGRGCQPKRWPRLRLCMVNKAAQMPGVWPSRSQVKTSFGRTEIPQMG